jgi:hypothetical protein
MVWIEPWTFSVTCQGDNVRDVVANISVELKISRFWFQMSSLFENKLSVGPNVSTSHLKTDDNVTHCGKAIPVTDRVGP